MDGTPPAGMPPAARHAYDALLEAPGSPVWTHPREDLLTPAMRGQVQAFAGTLAAHPPTWGPGEEPTWLPRWLPRAWADTPFHAARGPLPPRLVDIEPIDRTDLATDPAPFVPRGADLGALIAYSTSGTAGALTTVPSHPVTNASYIPLVIHAARPRVDLVLRPDVLDWVTVTDQSVGGFIVPSWSSVTGSLTAQISLRPHGWMQAGDAAAFLVRHDPRCITGDPVAFGALLDLDPDIRPRLLVSTASALSDGLRERLASRFGAPVLDLYSLTEAGPVAASLASAGPDGRTRHRLLQPRLFVEALRPDGSRADPGERGELTLTGGMNRSLPLIRYRTGDHAALRWWPSSAVPELVGLDGRAPVTFTADDGGIVNSHSVTVALRPLGIARFTLHQVHDGGLRMGVDEPQAPEVSRVPDLLRPLFGAGMDLTIGVLPEPAPGAAGGKVVPFSVDRPRD